jgi:hypothetical protein
MNFIGDFWKIFASFKGRSLYFLRMKRVGHKSESLLKENLGLKIPQKIDNHAEHYTSYFLLRYET